MFLNHLLTSLPPELGFQDFDVDANGICELTVDERLKIMIEEDPLTHGLHLYSIVASVAELDAVAAFATMLEAQLFGREIGDGMAFGLDQATSEIMLWRKMSTGDVESGAAVEILTEFINWVEHWHGKLHATAAERHVADEDRSMMEHFIRA